MTQTEQDRRIDYLEFPATNVQGTKEFYSAVFGWKFTDYGPDYTSFHDGRIGGGFTTAAKIAVGGVLIVLYARELDTIKKSIAEHGGRITRRRSSFPAGSAFISRIPRQRVVVWSEQ
jgi:predicted enzyme related to lactoylglutathione lyase